MGADVAGREVSTVKLHIYLGKIMYEKKKNPSHTEMRLNEVYATYLVST